MGLSVAGCSGEPGQAEVEITPLATRVLLGGEAYMTSCASCHGATGQGVPRMGTPLAGTSFVHQFEDEDLVAFLKQGRPGDGPDNVTGIPMPPRGGNPNLSDRDLGNIVAFLKTR
jgi:disulfide bond formation protein DsbB